MIDLLIAVIVFAVVGGLLIYLISLLPLPAPFPTVIRVCVVLICIFLLLGVIFGGVSLPTMNLRR